MGARRGNRNDIRLVATRTVDQRDPVRGATRGRCSRCSVEVWIAPSSRWEIARVKAANGKIDIVCVPCFTKNVDMRDDDEVYVAKGAVQEVTESLREHHERN